MNQLKLKECLEGIAYREYTCLDHEDYIAYLLCIPTDAFDYDFYDVNEFMLNSGFFDHYIEIGFESLFESYSFWENHVVSELKADLKLKVENVRYVLVRYSPSRDKFVIVADSANM